MNILSQKKNKIKKSEAIRNSKNFEKLLDIQYEKTGTGKRESFEKKLNILYSVNY